MILSPPKLGFADPVYRGEPFYLLRFFELCRRSE